MNAKIKMVSGGTRYAPALQHAKDISKKTHTKYSQLVYYFMSDGMPHDENEAMNEIESIKKESWISKVKFLAVGFGRSKFTVLGRMAKAFPNGEMMNAPTVVELKQSMQFILRADTGAAGKGQKAKKKATSNLKPLWNRSKLSVGD